MYIVYSILHIPNYFDYSCVIKVHSYTDTHVHTDTHVGRNFPYLTNNLNNLGIKIKFFLFLNAISSCPYTTSGFLLPARRAFFKGWDTKSVFCCQPGFEIQAWFKGSLLKCMFFFWLHDSWNKTFSCSRSQSLAQSHDFDLHYFIRHQSWAHSTYIRPLLVKKGNFEITKWCQVSHVEWVWLKLTLSLFIQPKNHHIFGSWQRTTHPNYQICHHSLVLFLWGRIELARAC